MLGSHVGSQVASGFGGNQGATWRWLGSGQGGGYGSWSGYGGGLGRGGGSRQGEGYSEGYGHGVMARRREEMEGKWLALIFLFTVLHHIPNATAFGNYNISESKWQISACMTSKPRQPGRAKTAFGIHGLWPVKSKGGTVVPVIDCQTTAIFDGRKITGPLRNDMLRLWPSLFDDAYVDFWKREWLKHGTCFDDVRYPETAVTNYFEQAVSGQKLTISAWSIYLPQAIGISIDYRPVISL
ncbi:unnamed protein product [Dovyalis caffra]|uniref:Uncharacterized protein n=1 Tax=Dovyalis caffra TaxID=77055 RepID=A0AAV1R3C2_9ROSI|nr:unnamed protein product [Dovyalis caffra]